MLQQTKVYAKWITILPLIGLCGCVSSKILKGDYDNYSEAYADSSNKQLLLNLARESHEEPAYFIQLASISSQYQFSTSVGITPSYVFRHSPASLGGSLSANVLQNPVFQFLPLTGTNFVQAVLTPITDKVFLTFYDQGWSADWVARTMVESVEELTITNGTTNIIENITTNIIKNGITNYNVQISITNYNVQISITNYEFWVNDPNDPLYPKFLEFCEDLRNAQRCHALTVDTASSKAAVYCNTNAKLTDVVSAVQSAGLSVKCDTNSGRITVTHTEQSPKWMNEIVLGVTNYPQYARFEVLFANASQTNQTHDTQRANKKLTHALALAKKVLDGNIILKMRTFEAVLYGVANEQRFFEYYVTNSRPYTTSTKIIFTNAPYGTIATVTLTNDTQFAVRPILMIKYDDNERSNLTTLIEINHNHVTYSIGDLEGKADPLYPDGLNPYQNRTVFSIISYLYLQTAISTQNLPVQQLIQVQ
jgi:hypothetical protein